jgi:uncharacterized protein (TIGR03435 family)
MLIGHISLRLNRNRNYLLLAGVWMALAAPTGIAQDSAAQAAASNPSLVAVPSKLPEFEVATIKPASPKDVVSGLFTYPGGRIICVQCTLHYLMMEAFDVQKWQITGSSGWIDNAQYDIEAKPPESSQAIKLNLNDPSHKTPPTPEQRQMLQSLLIDRFQLKFHYGPKQGPVYFLARGNKQIMLRSPKDPEAFHWAGIVDGGVSGKNISMPELAARLSGFLMRPVLDQTELMGSFDFEYQISDADPNTDVTDVIFTSMREIGLKLSTGRGSVETLVIDHVEKPSEN